MTLIKVMARCCIQTRSLPLRKACSYSSNRKALLLVPDFGWGPEWEQKNTANQCHVCKAKFLNCGPSSAITPSFSSLLLDSSGRPRQLKTSSFLGTNLPKPLTVSSAKPWKTPFQGKKQPSHHGGSIKSWAVLALIPKCKETTGTKDLVGSLGLLGITWLSYLG